VDPTTRNTQSIIEYFSFYSAGVKCPSAQPHPQSRKRWVLSPCIARPFTERSKNLATQDY